MLKKVTEFVKGLPRPVQILLALFLGYNLFKFVKKKMAVSEVTAPYVQGGKNPDGTHATTPAGLPFNAQACAVHLWELFYGSLMEDENAIIALLQSVPVNKIREVNSLYAAYLLSKKDSYTFFGWSWHYGKSLQEDAQYYLEDDYNKVSQFFNQL